MPTKISHEDVAIWMERLKAGWVNKQKNEVLKLFTNTERYYERPFNPGTTIEEIKGYWNDIDQLENITFDYEIVAIEGATACIHWNNEYIYEDKDHQLDGMFLIKFNDEKECIEFRQWWMEK